MRKRIKKGVACVLCASMVAALLGGCSSKNAESSKPSIHIESYTKVGYDTDRSVRRYFTNLEFKTFPG